jgi:hypothetical protein
MYKDVIEWLKFAETKNAALLTFNGVLVFGIIGLLSNSNKYIKTLFPQAFIGIYLLIVSTLLLLVSFLPFFNAVKSLKDAIPTRLTNFRYYKDIYKLSPEVYLKSIYRIYCNTDISTFNKGELDLAYQIVILSIITIRKYKIFTLSLILSGLSIIIPIVWVIFK